ncbi:MAG: hydrolase [Dehalococcoidales bacterium]|jgi:endoglucanase|nr:hydrolase [Dehalococcoidales bacterium]|tara:strand:+ start:379 stop:1440 length:1062 start_codon:yes stop_codon:yes gene_type:complete
MQQDSFDFLKRLVDTPGPSGYERQVQSVFRDRVAAYSTDVRTDVLGNVYATVNPGGSPRIMLAGHADEIGFQVRYISDEGMLYFGSIGGHDAIVTVGQRVMVHTANGSVLGVLGRKAIHLLNSDEREKTPKLDDLWIDIGASDKADAESVVAIGDCVTYDHELQQLRGDLCVARSFDDKMGVFIVAEALRLLSGTSIKASVIGVSTVQEEVGLRGARTSTFDVDPQIGIATDVGHSTDYPGGDKKKVGDVKLGGGPMITRGANINPVMFDLLVKTAKELEIPYQIQATPGGTGTDANAIQLNRAGVATGLIAVPLRYMHTPNEIMNLGDIEKAAQLMAGFCERVTAEIDWTPS